MRSAFAVALLAILVARLAVLPAAAGTTGGLAGDVTDAQTHQPIAGVAISASSPSQTASTISDARGHFVFLSLAPDTYTVSFTAHGYEGAGSPGITVSADQTQDVNVALKPALRQIASVKAQTPGLVKPGQTADVYTVNAQQAQAAQALGGGGGLFQTYAALSSVPGVYVPQNGLNQGQNNSAPYIRGGNFTQVGYEFDGVPVQREYDAYVGTTQGTTGQQQLQVYTGGGAASAASESLAGYVNQVIKTGTYPGQADVQGVVGAPSFYHYLSGEAGGSTPDRTFSYYAGVTGWNQFYRYGDQFNGGLGLNPATAALVPTGNGSVFAIPYAAGSAAGPANTLNREAVANLHFRIPHKHDAGSDDVQVLADIGRQLVNVYDSVNDLGGLSSPFWQYATGGKQPTYPTATVYQGPVFSPYDPSKLTTYYYPSAPAGATDIPSTLRGSEDSNNSLYKVQYQKNFGSDAYVRVYGYSNYSSWFVYDPIGAYYLPLPESGILGLLDDEVSTHVSGFALQFADQLSSNNLLQGSAQYTHANDLRWYNSTSYDPGVTVQLRGPTGACYDTTTGAATNCYESGTNVYGYNASTVIPAGPSVPAVPKGAPAGAAYEVVNSGYSVVIGQPQTNTVSSSLDDTWRPNDRWNFDLGLRFDSYEYGLGDSSVQGVVGGSNALYFSEFNTEHCYNQATATLVTVAPGAACAAGYAHTTLSNDTTNSLSYTVLEPRVSGTYTFSPTSVFRFSAGTYSQPTRAAYIQYEPTTDTAAYIAQHFLQYGFTTPSHDIPPQISHNYDLSYEARLAHFPLDFSFSPFYRLTNNQTQAFVLDPDSSFQSGLNVGTLRAFGYEFLARIGEPDKNGLSGQLAFTYTNSKIRYNDFSGTSRNVIDQLNSELSTAHYNSLTKSGGGSPCYTTTGAGAALAGNSCPAGTIFNPYYNSPQQNVTPLDPNGWYSPYNLIPTPNGDTIAFGYNSISYDVPEVLTAILQYRHNGFRAIPTFQYDTGFKYGSPFAWSGYDPSACSTTVTTSCATLFRPDPYTGTYDTLGAFASPSTFSIGLQLAQDLTKNVTVSAILTNLYQHCYTHGYAWETGGAHVCSYAVNPPQSSGGPYLGNATNANVNNALENDPYGYAPYSGSFPFNAYFSVQVKL